MDKQQAIAGMRNLIDSIADLHDTTTIYEDVRYQDIKRLHNLTKNVLYPVYNSVNECAGCFANKTMKGGGCAILTERFKNCKFKKTNAEYDAGL